jgi:hypothetical protein
MSVVEYAAAGDELRGSRSLRRCAIELKPEGRKLN